jgi:ABC-2 type transport system ATP-binding protein
MEKAVETKQLTKNYGAFTAVDSLDLGIGRGEVFGLLGPNGAGKTTTILMLLGLTEPTSGSASVLGMDPVSEPLRVKRATGYLPEDVEFYEDLTARENLFYLADLNGIRGRKARETVEEALEKVELTRVIDSPVGTFSKGMRQRLGLASVLLKEPSLAILDEPTTGIDPEGVEKMLALIRGLAKDSGVTVMLCSHMLYQVQKVCDRVGIMFRSSMIASGTIEEIGKKILGHRRKTIKIVSQEDTLPDEERLAAIEGLSGFRKSGGALVADFEEARQKEIIRDILEKGYLPMEVRGEEYSLEEIYMRYFQEV